MKISKKILKEFAKKIGFDEGAVGYFYLQEMLDEQRIEIIKDIEQMPETFPEMESDEYDTGFGIAKRDIIKRIKKL